MKKQKKPIFLVTGLAILLGVVMYMNKPAPSAKDMQTPPPQEAQPADKKEDVAGSVASQMTAKTPPKPKKPKMGPAGPSGPPGSSDGTVIKIKQAPYKPKPSDASTSTQWYTKESARSGSN